MGARRKQLKKQATLVSYMAYGQIVPSANRDFVSNQAQRLTNIQLFFYTHYNIMKRNSEISIIEMRQSLGRKFLNLLPKTNGIPNYFRIYFRWFNKFKLKLKLASLFVVVEVCGESLNSRVTQAEKLS